MPATRAHRLEPLSLIDLASPAPLQERIRPPAPPRAPQEPARPVPSRLARRQPPAARHRLARQRPFLLPMATPPQPALPHRPTCSLLALLSSCRSYPSPATRKTSFASAAASAPALP